MGALQKLRDAFTPGPNQAKPPSGFTGVISTGKHTELMYRPTLTGWTPDKVIAAGASADNGSLQQAADLVEAMFADDRISGVLKTRTHGLLGLPMKFTGGDPAALELLEGKDDQPGEWWKMHDEAELVKLLSWGITLGVGLAQRIPLPRVVGQPHRYRIEVWSPRWLRYRGQSANNTGTSAWSVLTENGEQPIVAGDGQWILFLPYGARRPWASGTWNELAIPWLLKRFSLEDRANHSETLGSAIWVGTASTGSTEKQRNRFLGQLRSLGKAAKLVLPNGWDMQLREATGKSWEIYTEQIKWADAAISIALAGQIVTTEGTSGFSTGNIFDNIKGDFIRFDGSRLASTLREQSLEPWAMLNYGARDKAPWCEWKTTKPVDLAAMAASIGALGDSITKLDGALKSHGLQVDARALVDEHGIPVTVLPKEPVLGVVPNA